MNKIIIFASIVALIESRWSVKKAQEWYTRHDWLVGCNFVPSSAGNQLEMWQVDTFDVETINRELQFAENIGFNVLRVFLHYLVWLEDSIGFKERINTFLDISSSHKIKIMFVFFDDCWNGYPKLGRQEGPIPGLHNSMWVQCPGKREVSNTSLFPIFKEYVQDIMSTYRVDPRVAIWDLYNEPGCVMNHQEYNNHEYDTVDLLKQVHLWAREITCIQPLTIGTYARGNEILVLNYDRLHLKFLI